MSAVESERISPILRLLADALDAREGTGDSQGVALRELGTLARLHIPIRGVLPLADDRLFNAIDKVAIQHLDLSGVRKTLNEALSKVEPCSARDEIEVALDHLCAVLNVAYFDAGLAFGVTLADLKSL